MNISYSRIGAYLSCPYRHYLSYIECLTVKKPARPLYFGSDFHKLLEHRNTVEGIEKTKQSIESQYDDLKPQFQEELGDNYLSNLFSIFDDYQEVYKDCPKPTVTEQEFRIPMGKYKGETVYFKGVIDELYKTKSAGKKSIKIGEHKTFNFKPDQSLLVMNTQKCLYAKACEFLYGTLPDGVIWDYIHSTPAEEPIWLEKSQRFSAAKSNKITPFSWRRACEKRGITDEAVLAEGSKYADNIPNYFFRVEQDFIPEMVEDVWTGFAYTAKQLVKFGRENKTKHITRDCTWCAFQPICYAELTGANKDYLIEKDYERYERKEG